MIRETIRPLVAWDTVLCSTVTLEPGAVLSGCRIEANAIANPDAGVEPYLMVFQASGRSYVCPLFRFQPRTQAVVV